MVPVANEFGWSRTAISAVMLISPLTVAIFSPFAGRAIDRWGVRKAVLPAVVLYGCFLLLVSQVRAGWQLLALYMLMSMCASLHTTTAYTKVVSLWFGRSRGLVIGLIIALGNNGGAALSPQLVRFCIQHHGWRSAYFVMGAIVICLGLPVISGCCESPPVSACKSICAIAAGGSAGPYPRRSASHSRLLADHRLHLSGAHVRLRHHQPLGGHAHRAGFTMGLAATALSCLYLGGIVGDLSAGFLMDRVHSPRIVIPYFVCALIGVTAIHHASTTFAVLAGAMVLGVCQGSEMGITAYLTSRFFGMRAYGTLYGMYYAVANLGIAVGMLSMGRVHTVTGSYKAMTPVWKGR